LNRPDIKSLGDLFLDLRIFECLQFSFATKFMATDAKAMQKGKPARQS
jgi:hypothetical protein